MTDVSGVGGGGEKKTMRMFGVGTGTAVRLSDVRVRSLFDVWRPNQALKLPCPTHCSLAAWAGAKSGYRVTTCMYIHT